MDFPCSWKYLITERNSEIPDVPRTLPAILRYDDRSETLWCLEISVPFSMQMNAADCVYKETKAEVDVNARIWVRRESFSRFTDVNGNGETVKMK
jgi:hypothetical protein